jgi:hypothetical protein
MALNLKISVAQVPWLIEGQGLNLPISTKLTVYKFTAYLEMTYMMMVY